MIQDSTDKLVSDFIYNHPDIVAKLLADNNIQVVKPLTLTSITQSTFTEMYKGNEKFIADLNYAISQGGYSNFIPLVIGAALSIGSMIGGANAAKKAREVQYKIALADLSQKKLLGEESIRSGAETDRTKYYFKHCSNIKAIYRRINAKNQGCLGYWNFRSFNRNYIRTFYFTNLRRIINYGCIVNWCWY